jgi:hypothetical protein
VLRRRVRRLCDRRGGSSRSHDDGPDEQRDEEQTDSDLEKVADPVVVHALILGALASGRIGEGADQLREGRIADSRMTSSLSETTPRASGSPDQPVRERKEHELGARLELQLAHDVCAVRIDGSDRDEELLADLLVRVSECEQVENIALPVR